MPASAMEKMTMSDGAEIAVYRAIPSGERRGGSGSGAGDFRADRAYPRDGGRICRGGVRGACSCPVRPRTSRIRGGIYGTGFRSRGGIGAKATPVRSVAAGCADLHRCARGPGVRRRLLLRRVGRVDGDDATDGGWRPLRVITAARFPASSTKNRKCRSSPILGDTITAFRWKVSKK